MKLDIIDKKLLFLLELDSSTSYKQLAKKLRVSPEGVAYRLRRLERSGVILRYHAIVDMSRFGYETYRVYIKWQDITLAKKEQFYQFLGKFSSVWTIAKLHGKWDLAFFVGVKHSSELHVLWDAIDSLYKSQIAESRIAIYAPTHNYNKKFFTEELDTSVQRDSGGNLPSDFDAVDHAIVFAYGKDIRQPLHAVAATVGKSVETVRQRIRHMEIERVLVGYKLDIDLDKFGMQIYRVDFALTSTARQLEIMEYIRTHRYFYQVNNSIGGADFECEIVVNSLVHLLEELERFVTRFKDVVRSYEYFGCTGFPLLGIVPD